MGQLLIWHTHRHRWLNEAGLGVDAMPTKLQTIRAYNRRMTSADSRLAPLV